MQSQINTLGLNQCLTIILASMGIPWFWNPISLEIPLVLGSTDEPPCYVGQYMSMRIKSLIILSRGNYTAFDSMYCNTQLLVFRFSFLCYT